MNKKIYKMLCANYNKELDKEMYEFLEEELKEYDPLIVEIAIKELIRNERYMPNLAKILDAIQNITFIEISEEQKIARWEEKGIHPKWLDTKITYKETDEKELEQLKKDFEIFK